jgi:glycosyltransferase involved in cell wall biosynthesis
MIGPNVSADSTWAGAVMDNNYQPIRVTIVQPSLAKYRVPVFRELAARPGIDLQVVYGVNPGIPNVEADGFRTIPLPRWHRRIAGSLVMAQRAEWSYCTRKHSDVVVLRWSPRSLTQPPALLRARRQGVGTVLWGHGYSKQDRGWWRSARNWLADQASAILFYEPETRAAYIDKGWNGDRLFVALNSLEHRDIERSRKWWLEHPEELATFRRQHGLNNGPVILFVSRHQPANRVDLLIEATARIRQSVPELKTVIIGSGEPERGRLLSIAQREKISDRIVFVDGIYDEMKLAPWFMSSSIYCYPANIGLSLIHALWYGLPAVTSNNRELQNPEIVALKHNINGMTYEHGSVESLTVTLNTLLSNDLLRARMSQAARHTVENGFTISHMVDGMEAAIRFAHRTVQNTAKKISYSPQSTSALNAADPGSP